MANYNSNSNINLTKVNHNNYLKVHKTPNIHVRLVVLLFIDIFRFDGVICCAGTEWPYILFDSTTHQCSLVFATSQPAIANGYRY